MKIAFNPSTVAALIAPPNNKDITFDLRGQNIFARGVKFCGTDTNTWRDIKINNVSIDSNTLDLRDGDNTTLTNINGVVTINSTWRPVVDNLTSDSTTSSLSANLGRVLKSLIDGKSDSDHNHDDRYLRLTGGLMLGDINFGSDNRIYWGRNTDSASISFKNDGDGDADSYMSFVTSDNGNEYFRWSHSSGSTNTEWMALRSDGLRVGGTKVSLEGHSHNDLYYTKTEVNNKLNGKSDTDHTHDDRYLKLTGGTMLLGEGLKFHADDNYFGTNEDARIISLLDGNDKICDGGLIIDERATYNGTEYVTELLRIRDSEFKWKGSNILHSGNTYVNNNKGYINNTEITLVNNSDTIDGIDSSGFLRWKGMLNIGNNAPFQAVVDIIKDTSKLNDGGLSFYSYAGDEYTVLIGSRNDAARHGNALKWGYANKYLWMIRMTNGFPKSSDWEKISAGYADNSGNTDLLDGYHASGLFTNLSNSGNNISITIGGTNKTLTVGYASTATLVSKSLKWTDATGTALSYNGGTEKSITSLNFPYNQIALNFRHPGDGYATKILYMTAGNEALVFAAQNSVTSFIFKSGANITNSNLWYDQVPTPTLQLKGLSAYINKLIANGSVPAFNFLVNGSSRFDGKLWQLYSTRTDPNATCIRDSAIACFGEYDDDAMWIGNNTNNGTWILVSFKGDEDRPSKNYLYNLSLLPLGGNVGIGTNSPTEKLTVNGWIGTNGIYTNRTGSSTDGGVSLYSNVDPMTYGIALRGTGTYGTHGYVTSAGDWATYLTMNDSITRGWIFRRGDTNVASIAGSGNMAIGLHLEFSNGAHISTNRSTDYHYGYTFNLGDNAKSIGMYSGPVGEAGGVVISPDGCLIYNSSDCGYNLQVRDKDLGSDLTNITTLTFGIELSGYYAWSRGGFKKNGSSDSYVLLGGGGHKAENALNVSNADTVDGYHANSLPYAPLKELWIDMTGYSESYWHPVVTSLPYNGYKKIKVTVQLNSGTKPSWSTHSSGFTCNFEAYVTASGWGTTISETIVLNNSYQFANANPVGFGQLSYSSQAVLYLRGGGRYCILTDWDSSWNIYNQSYTWTSGSYSQTAGPYTSNPGCFVGLSKNWIYAHTCGNIITDDWLSIRDYAGSYHGRSNNISGYAGEIWFGGNFHIDSQNSQNLYLNYYTSAIVSIAQGGGNVGIGTDSPSYKLDVNGLMRANGFRHSGHNSDDAVLLAGGGYKTLSDLTNNYYWAYDNKYIKLPICLEFVTFVSYRLTNSIWSNPTYTNESGVTKLTIPNLTVPYNYDVYALVISHSNPNTYATITTTTPLLVKITHRESSSGYFAVMIWAIPS